VTRALRIPAVALLLALSCAPGLAFSPALTSAQLHKALADGRSEAASRAGYPVAAYSLYAVPNALVIAPGQGSIDAIVVGTPFERVRYASYLAAFQGSQPGASDVADAAEAESVDFVVFAHGGAHDDQKFLQRFHAASIEAAGRLLQPERTTAFGPTEDFFTTTKGNRVFRWLGYDTYRFDVRSLARAGVDIARLRGTFRITDPYGRQRAYAFDLSKYR
jgi:hypothetical protein